VSVKYGAEIAPLISLVDGDGLVGVALVPKAVGLEGDDVSGLGEVEAPNDGAFVDSGGLETTSFGEANESKETGPVVILDGAFDGNPNVDLEDGEESVVSLV
jgi:hypothetical protein